jgi:hypothetical protein
MIDLILALFTVGVFAGGFWCGAKYRTYGEMWKALKAYF